MLMEYICRIFELLFVAKAVAELPECTQDNMADMTRGFYQHFIPIVDEKSKGPKSDQSSKSSSARK